MTPSDLANISGADQLRRAVKVLDGMSEDFNAEYTSEELLKLVRACWLSDWDITPDQWTQAQVEAAIESGTVPRFEELPTGIHAVGVGDCYCRQCNRERFKSASVDVIMDVPR